MFVTDKAVQKEHLLLLTSGLESITPSRWNGATLRPAARDDFTNLMDLCLLGNGERPQFLQLEYLRKAIAL